MLVCVVSNRYVKMKKNKKLIAHLLLLLLLLLLLFYFLFWKCKLHGLSS